MTTDPVLDIDRGGQSLIEVLVAVSIGMLLVIGGIAVIVPSVKTTTDTGRLRTSALLGRELLERVGALAETNWGEAMAAPEGPDAHYYVSATSSPFSRASGDEAITVATTSYLRYYFITSVARDSGGAIVGLGSPDNSTKKVTVVYGMVGNPTSTMEAYVTRSRNRVFIQSDWSGGGGVGGPVTVPGTTFASSSAGVNISATTGSIMLDL